MPLPPGSSDSDTEDLATARNGDAAAFATLFHRHYPAIHAFAYRLSLCPAEADDIAQETFVHAARALSAYRGDASFKNWLFSIAANRGRDRHRSRARRQLREQEFALVSSDSPAAPTGASHSADTDSAHAAVRAALGRLSPEQREAVALVYFENLSHAEAARVLGCAESTVSWRVFRARHRLKKLLRDVAPAAPRHE